MAQRLLRIVVPEDGEDRVRAILQEAGAEAGWTTTSAGLVATEVLLRAEGNDILLDALQDAFQDREGFRLLVMPVSASLPEEEDYEEDQDEEEGGESLRVSRAELYVRIEDIGSLSVYHLAMVALSAVIACVGLVQDSSAVVVGAMVIAPVLGPSMALSLATTLGDLKLARDAFATGIAGFGIAVAIAAFWGWVGTIDPSSDELLRASQTGYPELLLALAAGAAGVLSISRGAATALVGVMVAVALLPPAVAAGLLLGTGLLDVAFRAFTVVASNLICINLAGVATFLLQGIRPRSWWEEDRARRATRIALVLWLVLLLATIFLISRIEMEAQLP